MGSTVQPFQTRLAFVPRKQRYSSETLSLWTLVLPPQTMKSLRILHDSPFVLSSSGNRRALVRVHNALEHGVEFSSLRPPKALAAEELIMSLDLSPSTESDVTFESVSQTENADRVCLKFLQAFDIKDNTWKTMSDRKDRLQHHDKKHLMGSDSTEPNLSAPLNEMGDDEGRLDWFVSSDDSTLHPPVKWYDDLLAGRFNTLICSSLLGTGLFPGNVALVSLSGYMCRFLVTSVSAKAADPSAVLSLGLETDIVLERDFRLHSIESPTDPATVDDSPVICGLDSVIETLNTQVVAPLLSDLGFSPPSGVLLYGPPGCGKTFLARTIRDHYRRLFNTDQKIGFKMVHSTDLLSRYVGSTEVKLNALFQELKHKSWEHKMICFIDEIDILCKSRENRESDKTSRTILTTLLNNMDGLKADNKNFVIIGLTNYPDSIDNAMRRPGRFDLEVEVPVPTSENRLAILNHLLRKAKHSLSEDEIRQVNDFCQAFVGADLKLLLTNANHAMFRRLKGRQGSEPSPLTHQDFVEALKVTRPSAMRELYLEVPHVRWSDIGGYEDLKRTIRESVEYPRRFSSLYERLHIHVPKGILLYGPPGCSKTLMAKAICTESHMNFISVKGPEIFDKYVGESERNIRSLFKKARINSPCVIFFDEIDSICMQSSSVGRRVLSTLLTEMDGVSSLKQVLVVGATNRPQDLSASLLRPGRFDKLIYVPLPDLEARRAIFLLNLRRLKLDFDPEEASAALAERTEGYSGAEVVAVCRQASMYLLSEIIESLEAREGAQFLWHTPAHTCNEKNDSVSPDLAADFDRLSLHELRPLSFRHLEKALVNSKPLTSPSMVSFFEEYSRKTL